MTKKTALELAIATLSTDNSNDEAVKVLNEMIAQLNKRNERTPEQKEATNAKRKTATAEARAKVVAMVAPILRKYLNNPVTAKQLTELASAELPAGFTVARVQNVLLREMVDELIRVQTKGKPSTYQLKG